MVRRGCWRGLSATGEEFQITKHRTKLWLGLGSFLLAGVSTAALVFGAGGAGTNVTVLDGVRSGGEIATGNEGGEGGERGRSKAGGEAGRTDGSDVNVRFLTLLALMEGHMDVGKRLLHLSHHEMAMPHFHHPYLEVYEAVEKDLTARGVPPFETTLKDLGRAGDSRNAEKISHEYAEAKEAIAKARAAIPAEARDSAKVQLQAAIALLKAAAHEYEEAVRDGMFSVVEEYQDGWGFVQVAERTIAGVSAQIRNISPDVDDRIKEHLRALKRAWPDAVPPERAIVSTDDVHAMVSRIELAASRIIQ